MLKSIKKCIPLSVIFLSGCSEPIDDFQKAFEYDLCAKFYFYTEGGSSNSGRMYQFSRDKSLKYFQAAATDEDYKKMDQIISEFESSHNSQQSFKWADDSCYRYVHYVYIQATNIF